MASEAKDGVAPASRQEGVLREEQHLHAALCAENARCFCLKKSHATKSKTTAMINEYCAGDVARVARDNAARESGQDAPSREEWHLHCHLKLQSVSISIFI